MMKDPLISVVIATYNGANYIAEQLDSIFSQTHKNIEVILCDDQSTDATIEIVKQFQKKHRLQIFRNEVKQGVIKNFEKAIAYAQGDYIALSDQDDIWLPEKLEQSLKRLSGIEKLKGTGLPVIVFSDLVVVDNNLNIISPSYWSYMKLNPANTELNRILVENIVTGCTLMMNRATITLALPIPKGALMHDVWFLLVASCFGHVGCLPQQTVLYRQHSQNVVGARSKDLLQKLYSAYIKIKESRFSLLQPEIEQARAFYEQYQQELRTVPEKKAILEDFVNLKGFNIIRKKYLIYKNGFFGSTYLKALNILLRA